jgi:hypothetical protein
MACSGRTLLFNFTFIYYYIIRDKFFYASFSCFLGNDVAGICAFVCPMYLPSLEVSAASFVNDKCH